MNDSESRSSKAEPSSDPDSSSRIATDGERPHERWLDRLKAALGLKAPATIREDLAEALSDDEVSAAFTPEERAMLSNILRLREVRVDDVMVPRADIDAVDIGITVGDLLVKFRESGHSRMPVFRETLDDPVGFVHIKDLMAYMTMAAAGPETLQEGVKREIDLGKVDLTKNLAEADLVRNILFVPPSMPVPALLASMQATRMQLALVIDEYGGTEGLVSLEDIVEVIVGDIEDEHDVDEDVPLIEEKGDGTFIVDAKAELEDVAQAVGSDFQTGDYGEDVDTIGGLLFALAGRVPVRGEVIEGLGYEFRVIDADPRRLKRIELSVSKRKRARKPA
jgi:CBS domain containing-hemolysin-like protein